MRKTFNGRRFKRFLKNEIAPLLQPYNGVNNNSVVIMAKCRRHDSAIAQEIYLFHFVVDNAAKVTIICMKIAK